MKLLISYSCIFQLNKDEAENYDTNLTYPE